MALGGYLSSISGLSLPYTLFSAATDGGPVANVCVTMYDKLDQQPVIQVNVQMMAKNGQLVNETLILSRTLNDFSLDQSDRAFIDVSTNNIVLVTLAANAGGDGPALQWVCGKRSVVV